MSDDLQHRRARSWGALVAILVVLAPAAAAAAWVANLTVSQHGLRFSQAKVAIRQGDTLTFSNDDQVTHNISVRAGGEGDTQDLGLQKPGVLVAHRFDQKGVYSIVCSIHPKMRLTVNVD